MALAALGLLLGACFLSEGIEPGNRDVIVALNDAPFGQTVVRVLYSGWRGTTATHHPSRIIAGARRLHHGKLHCRNLGRAA
jgi:hypothetical protein